jgi:phenylacetyl-CoA:acceptor oxidoreductase subunit 1
MTRYAMAIDLRRCVGCQTCTAACKQKNATPPGVQWRRVLDIETGEFPDVRRSFMPVACMHCDEPPCEEVCPTTATKKRRDGLVSIDYDLCIGCSNCVMACPYEARTIAPEGQFAYGSEPMANEEKLYDPARTEVATKCTFCIERIDQAEATGLTPGIDHQVTPACVNSCASGALLFGDIEDPDSRISKLLKQTQSFRQHEELGSGPGVYYIWDNKHESL